MAYKQNPRGNFAKTGHGMAPLMQQVAGTEANTSKFKDTFKKMGQNFSSNSSIEPSTTGYFEEQELRRKNPGLAASYDMLSKSGLMKANPTDSVLYGKGSANPADTSAETMTLKANANQLPGGAGFAGATSADQKAIFPTIKPSDKSGRISSAQEFVPQRPRAEQPNAAVNTADSYYFTSNKKGNLGKLETLNTKQYNDKSKQGIIGESFGAMDQFNQTMGGTANPSKVGRDRTYGTILGQDTRANVLTTASGPGRNADTQENLVNRVKAEGKNNFSKQAIFNNPESQEALRTGDVDSLLNTAQQSGKAGETAANYIKGNMAAVTPKGTGAGYESTYKQKYDYPTEKQSGEFGNTYSGNKGGGYLSPASTLAQNVMAAKVADYNTSFRDFLTKGKSKNSGTIFGR